MATQLDFYAVLEVSRDASPDDLKKAYRKQAMRWHPDRNPGDAEAEEKFKAVNVAYDVLKDEQKRAAYDRFGHEAFTQGGMGSGGGGFGGFGAGGLGDIFEQMFGDMMGGRRSGGRHTGADIQIQVEISLFEAFSGVSKEVSFRTRMTCDVCGGSGSADPDAGPSTCPTCHGAGKVRAQQGFFLVERPCPTCHGSGTTVSNPCRACQGTGAKQTTRTLSVTIPAGVEDGSRIRLSGEGESGGKGAQPGDLYVHLAIARHDMFERDGAHIHMRVPLRMTQAALGTDIEVPVIDGSMAMLKIPAGTQSGDQLRLRGKGFSVLRSSARGDMYIHVAVETPQHLTKRQRELLEEYEAEAGEQDRAKASPEHASFFARVKDFFEGKG